LKPDLLKTLKKKILVCDGAMGTQLQAHGLGPGEPPDLWNIAHPQVIRQIHRSYLDAGADIILTNTFGASRFKLAYFDLEERTAEINMAAARLARAEAGEEHFVFGDIGPTGRLVAPLGPDPLENFYQVFKEQAQALAEGGVDAIIIETMLALDEAKAAVLAVKENIRLPLIALMKFEKGRTSDDYHTVMGVSIPQAIKDLAQAGADILGSNCVSGVNTATAIIKRMRPLTDKPLMAEPNAGVPRLISGETIYDEGPDEMEAGIDDLIAAGANIIGGCCGTTPEHIQRIVRRVQEYQTNI